METKLGANQETPGYRAMLKAILKRQIQHLVEQLSTETDEECVFLTASITDRTLTHLGSDTGKSFLDTNKDFESQFLGFCLTEKYEKESNQNRTSVENYASIYPEGNTSGLKRMKPSLVSQRHPLLPHKTPRKNPYPIYKPTSMITNNVNVEKITTDTGGFSVSLEASDTNSKHFLDMETDEGYPNSMYQGQDIEILNELNVQKKSKVRIVVHGAADKESVVSSHGKNRDGHGEYGTNSSTDAFTNDGPVSLRIKMEPIDFEDGSITSCSTAVNQAEILTRKKSSFYEEKSNTLVKTEADHSLQNISASEHHNNAHASPKETLLNVYNNIFQSMNQERGTRSSCFGTGSKSSARIKRDNLNDSNSDLNNSTGELGGNCSLSFDRLGLRPSSEGNCSLSSDRLGPGPSLSNKGGDSPGLAISRRDLSNPSQNESNPVTVKKKRKRNDLTLADRYKVLKLLDKKLTQTEISKIIGCSISQVCRINGHRDKILAQYFSNTNPDRKRQRTGKASDIDIALKTFYEEARDKGVPPTASVLTEMARDLAQELKVPDFFPGGSWLSRWKIRCNIGGKLPRAEKKSDPE